MNFALDEQDVARIAAAVAERIQPERSAWLTKEQAAEYLHCSTRHVSKLVYLGELPAYKPCGKQLFREQDLHKFVTDRRED